MRDTQGQLQAVDKTGVQADMQALKDELHATLDFLNGPPKEALQILEAHQKHLTTCRQG